MRSALVSVLGSFLVASTLFAQGSTDDPVDGSMPGKILLVLRERPPGKPALIVREPKYLGVRQRSILYFSPQGTPGELAMALIAFDRIRAEDGEVITEAKTTDNIGTFRGDTTRDATTKAYRVSYLQEMQSLLDFARSTPEHMLRGVGKVHWIEVDRPVATRKP